ncbi:MAG: hypothetical protein IJP38_08760, partial [Oscillospiraceae bacterium]|nr:hypothetical protein [Oscillospiraceae bacterium]
MKNRAKKFLSLILAMAMLVSTFSVAFAAEEEASAELFADEAATVAEGTTVTTEEALSSAIANGGTIILGADIEVTSTLRIVNVTTLDLNGHTLTSNASSGNVFNMSHRNGSLKITDSSERKDGKIISTGTSVITINAAYGVLEIDAGVIEAANYCIRTSANSTVTISGGAFVGGKGAVNIAGGDVDISGGTFTGSRYSVNIAGGDVNITGGTFLKNGEADTSVATYLPEGLALDANGNVVDASTIVIPPVAKIGETGYASLAAAVEAAQSGDTITLVESPCRIDETISITKNITIDFNGCGITGSSVSPFAISGATLTLVNSGATSSATMSVGRAITLTNGAVLNLESGTLQGTINAVTTISATDSTVNISGGRVVNTSSSSSCTINAINSKINITSGLINSKAKALSADADSEVSITGGRFLANNLADETIETYLSSGYELDASGNVVVATPVVAKIGDVGYASLAAAVEAAQSGDTITVVDDAELGDTLIIDKAGSITIDGNGKKITLADSFTNTNTWGAAIMLGNSGYGDPFTAYHAVTIKNVVFEGITGNAIIRAQGITLTVDGCTVANCDSTNTDQGMFRIDSTVATIKNSTFDNNKATKILGHNHNTSGSDSGMVVDNVSFTDNTITGPGVIVLSSDAGATIKDSEFTGNNVACTNGAVVYMGFTENNAVTGNLFKDNVVSGNNSNNRIAGALFLGWEAEVSGNAFV